MEDEKRTRKNIIKKALEIEMIINKIGTHVKIADMNDVQIVNVLTDIDIAIALSPHGRAKMAYDKVKAMQDAPDNDRDFIAAFAYFYTE